MKYAEIASAITGKNQMYQCALRRLIGFFRVVIALLKMSGIEVSRSEHREYHHHQEQGAAALGFDIGQRPQLDQRHQYRQQKNVEHGPTTDRFDKAIQVILEGQSLPIAGGDGQIKEDQK